MAAIPGALQSQQTQLEQLGLNSAQTNAKTEQSTTDFLKLFVTQLQNQNPLEPQEGAEFLSQLAQFSTVEGIQNLDTSFSKMANTLQSTTALQATSMVGRQVEIPTDEAKLTSGQPMQGSIDVPSSVSDLSLELVNGEGLVVKTMKLGTVSPGHFPFSWNGLDDNETAVPSGSYSLRAKGTIDGEETRFATFSQANVDSVTIDSNGKGLMLNVSGHGSISIDDVRKIS